MIPNGAINFPDQTGSNFLNKYMQTYSLESAMIMKAIRSLC